ncbi:MAG: TraB/GumN family protein [Thiohalophilus sp.]|uniref:TraB/GumN family protein n=1 Tax=Thiohalophilus sp. TaxID=3028392 RepID=UPI0028700E36|nr:TraB/GumN family protein [Thiohalophilus sp.]MDR9437689.1 TraB/GumN family protein [Thiohalophilus sp.]
MKQLNFGISRIATTGLLLVALCVAHAKEQQGILWEVVPESGQASYLLGTIHSEDPRVTRLPPLVKKKFDQSKIFCAEMKMNAGTQIQMSQGMMYLDGQKLDQQIDRELYQKTVTLIADYGIPEQLVPMFKPWAVGLLLSVPKPESGMFLDYVLYQTAQEQGKQLCGLETPEEVVGLFDNTPLKTQISLLRVAVREHSNLDEMVEEMLQIYLARDLDELLEFSERELEKSGKDVSALVNDSLIEQRNRNMLETMQTQLKKGNAFIAVGALHLPGDVGLLRMLEAQGYRVNAVY